MPSLEKITAAHFPEIYAHLLRDWEPRLPEETWRRVFPPPWTTHQEYLGYVLLQNGQPVGMIGTLFGSREIDGVTRRFCNLHSWIVQPEYRGLSLLLLKPVLALTDHTLTDFTPTPRVAEISKRLGMQTLDDAAFILPPLPTAGGRTRANIEELTEDAQLAEVPDAVAKVYRDHSATPCRHMLVRSGDELCYLAFSIVERHRLPYCLLHEVSNPQLFRREHAAIRRQLLRLTRAAYVVSDSRLLAGHRPPWSLRVRATEKLFRSPDLQPHQISSLYSEMVLLEHTTLPGLRDRLRAAKNRLPFYKSVN